MIWNPNHKPTPRRGFGGGSNTKIQTLRKHTNLKLTLYDLEPQ